LVKKHITLLTDMTFKKISQKKLQYIVYGINYTYEGHRILKKNEMITIYYIHEILKHFIPIFKQIHLMISRNSR
jgi:hypothetical protein